jgi:hypothetical protein
MIKEDRLFDKNVKIFAVAYVVVLALLWFGIQVLGT